MIPTREGLYLAAACEQGIGKSKNGALQFTVKLRLAYEQDENGEWVEVNGDFDITHYIYLQKKDKSWNDMAFDQCFNAWGWDGRDVMWLQDTDLSQTLVQITLGYEEYAGKQRMRVQWLDHRDAKPRGVKKADEALRKELATTVNPKLRARAGSQAVAPPVPAKPEAAPTKPPAANRPATPPPENMLEKAWKEFKHVSPIGLTDEMLNTKWFDSLEKAFPGVPQEDLTDDQWEAFIKSLDEVPF